jgi:hypothetical protein
MLSVTRVIVCFIGFLLVCSFFAVPGFPQEGGNLSSDEIVNGSIMQPDSETRDKWYEEFERMTAARLDEKVATRLSQAEEEGRSTSKSLLDYLSYVPEDRQQGACGDCWVWTGTGIVEIALNLEKGIKDRHSIQLFNSCRGGQYACCGGTAALFADWYRGNEYSIPWSNTNASFADGARTCAMGSSTVSCVDIAKKPDYPITSITAVRIPTMKVGQAAAIANIKNVLNQNKAIYYAYDLATKADWDNFRNFWNNKDETAVWSPDPLCGHARDAGGGAHAVLLVGYNDDDPNPANHYWVMLNSWGTAKGGRPHGLFRIPMRINYDCTINDGGKVRYISWFFTLDINFDKKVELPRTGQTACYDRDGNVISCADTGQDGDVRAGVPWANPRFIDNKDGTVTDTLTGLMWTRDGCTPGPKVCQIPYEGSKTWPLGLKYVACLNSQNYLGYTDWRMPNILELVSLYNDGTPTPTDWLRSQAFGCVLDTNWSSSASGYPYRFSIDTAHIDGWQGDLVTHNIWPVRTTGGGQAKLWKTGIQNCYDPTTYQKIDCAGTGQDGELRKGVAWPEPRFTDLGTGIVTDNLTGLWWTKEACNPGPSQCNPGKSVPWLQSFDFIKCLNEHNYLGYSDWRMANRTEFLAFHDFGSGLPAGFPFSCYDKVLWASDSHPQVPWRSWVLWYGDYDKGYNGYTWPVRGGAIYKALFVKKAGAGTGTVMSSPEGISCGADCTWGFKKGSSIALSATPDPDFIFGGWSGAGCSGMGACNLTLTEDMTVTATFGTSCAYTISPTQTVLPQKGGAKTIGINAKGKNCPAPDVSTLDTWFTLGPVSFSKNKGSVKVSAGPNNLSILRPGSVFVAGQTVTVSQPGKPCALGAFIPPKATHDKFIQTGEFTVTASPPDCGWTTAPQTGSEWIAVVSGSQGTGAGMVSYSIEANIKGKPRTGKVGVTLKGNKKVKVFQVKQNK